MRIGIDLGGTKTEAIVLADDGRECFRQRVPTPKNDYQGTLRTIAMLVDAAERATGASGSVGGGIPGTLSPLTQNVKNANSVWLNGQALDKDLSALLRRPVRIANDANCLAVSEAVDGAGAGSRVVFAVIIGTGCGAGVALDGKVHSGRNGVAGEWGHNPLPWQDEEELRRRQAMPCYCGKSGCIETFISGTGFMADYRLLTGRDCSGETIVSLAAQGDAAAERVLQNYERRLAKSIAHAINLLDPDVVVLGGGMSNVRRLYRTLPERVKSWVFGGECTTPIRQARHGDSSGVRGAAWLWPLT